MEWYLVSAFGGVVFAFLVQAAWKSWLIGYTTEKGKGLARKEDLDAILAEVRAVTVTQKEIEARITQGVWTQQTLWQQKRELYGELIRLFTEVEVSTHRIALKVGDRALNEQETRFLVGQGDKIDELTSILASRFGLAQIFLSPAAVKAIHGFLVHEAASGEPAVTVRKVIARLGVAKAELIAAAVDDLGLPPREPTTQSLWQ